MPEGPEVRKNVDFLNAACKGKKLISLKIQSGRYVKHGPFSGYESLVKSDLKINNVSCKGKFIYFEFDNGSSLWSTLGMSGIWQTYPTQHTRVQLTVSGGTCVYFNDVRNFGTLKFVSDRQALDKKLRTLGPDMLNDDVSFETFKERFQKASKKTIAESLMNQAVIAGIGNYLKAEILYAAEISPHRLCGSITEAEYADLHQACDLLPSLSYAQGGATLATYRDADGKPGDFSRRFAVYNQKFDPQGNPVIREQTKDKRTTHWVPKIQA